MPPPRASVGRALSDHAAGSFRVQLRSDTQTLVRLSPVSDPAFSFTPAWLEPKRAGSGNNHFGDLHLRVRAAGATEAGWIDCSTSAPRGAIRPLPRGPHELAAADLTGALGGDCGVQVERRWIADGDALVLRFRITNPGGMPVELGIIGMPMVFDNVLTGRSLEQAHAQATFADPSIALDAGYVQVTRLNGRGPVLLVLPEPGTPLESWVPLPTTREAPTAAFRDGGERSQTSEGFYDWTVRSLGYVQHEWREAKGPQWNPPTSELLPAGATRTFGLRMVQSPSIRGIEATLARHSRPVAVSIPGYIVPNDLPASLFLSGPGAIARMDVAPVGSLTLEPANSQGEWRRYSVRSTGYGRATLTITYEGGTRQSIAWYRTKPLEQVHADLGKFTFEHQWYEGKGDPFGRSPAILTYDKGTRAIVDVEPRVWIAGMSDEGGGGSWVAAAMKELDHPVRTEVAQLEHLVDETVLGHLQVADGAHAGAVRKSLFYYDPQHFPGLYDDPTRWSSWTSWNRQTASDVGRAYNYPHVAIGHWVLYRLGRNHPGLLTRHEPRWYLEHAWLTAIAMMRDAPYYTRFGLMEGNVFVDILDDLRSEGLDAQADELERQMRARARHWNGLRYPFGSEMPWDSTGQPEVHAWLRHFGYDRQAALTREVILGYDPAIPSWGYNGNARRYWDFLYAGKYPRIERQIHHYGSTNNALPLFTDFRRDPSDLYLLRVAYGGLLGGITNIGVDGFGSTAFHSWPDHMAWDDYSGDYGMGYYAHAIAAASYLVNDPTLGWLCFGCLMSQQADGRVQLEPRDGSRTRLYVAPSKQWITLQAGRIASAVWDPTARHIELILDPADDLDPVAHLYIEATRTAPWVPDHGTRERGGWSVPLGEQPTTLVITAH